MFWGLIMEPNKRYTQTVERPFHISQAAMDTSTGENEICQVMVLVEGKNFLLCTLQKNRTIQVPLDLYFKAGAVVSFLSNGKSNVHLTGYLDPEYDDEDSEGEEEEEAEAPRLVPAAKRKLEAGAESATKKLKQETKKLLLNQQAAKPDTDDSSSEEDGVDDLQQLLDGDVDSDENDDSFRPNSTGGDSEDDSGEEEEEEAEEEEEDKSEEETSAADTSKEETPKKLSKSQKRRLKKLQQKEAEQPQTNGVEKKKKKEQPEQKQKGKPEAEKSAASPDKREKKSLSGGVQIEDLKVGSGPAAKAGKVLQVYYEGRLKQNNKMFDSCAKGPGFKFRLGSKEVITGWDVGIAGMKVGGKRKIVCPAPMAYGAKGSPPVIPPNSALVFEVELKNVK